MKTNTIDLQAIQQQIQTNGAFSPLHWLLEVGFLPYCEYDNWRYGRRANLDGAFSLDNDELLSLLNEASKQSKVLKLCAENQDFHAWDSENAARNLKLSQRQDLNQLLCKRWVRPEDLPQMDLFMDCGPVEAENQLIEAIGQRQWSDAEQAYQQFCEMAAESVKLGDYETLLLYGKYTSSPDIVDEGQAIEELEALKLEIAPKAQALLRHQARDYLGGAWQRLAQYLPRRTFNPLEPSHHASFAYAQLPDWPKVGESIKEIENYQQHAALLIRLADSYWHVYEEVALLLLAQAARLPQGEVLLDRDVLQPRFKDLWEAFWELDLTAEHFSSWLLIKEPGLLHFLEAMPFTPEHDPVFSATTQILSSKEDEHSNIRARQELKTLCEPLFNAYLNKT